MLDQHVNLGSFSVNLASLFVLNDHLATHDIFVGCRYDSNQEVEHDDQHKELVDKPKDPNRAFHERVFVIIFPVRNIRSSDVAN